jgi:hypothetical protein
MRRITTIPVLARRTGALTLVGAALGLMLGCSPDEVLDVTDPDIIEPEASRSPEGADAARVGALTRFNIATSGGESFFLYGGLLADEWRSGDTFQQRDETDKRTVQTSNSNINTGLRDLHRARLAAGNAVALLKEFAPTPSWKIGQMYWEQGYIEVMIGEHFCAGVFSGVDGDQIIYGTPLPDTAIFLRALAHFDSASMNLALGGSAADTTRTVQVQHLTALGKGRALLNLGRHAEAAAAVTAVPANFRFVSEHSLTTRQNQVWALNNSARRYTMVNRDGGNGLDFIAAADPRLPRCNGGDATCRAQTPSITSNRSFDSSTPFTAQLVMPTRESSAPVATGTEARLIIAESHLKAGNDVQWLAELNALRTGVTGLTPLVMPATAVDRENLMFRERAFWMFGTGHRLGDLRRLVRQYNRADTTVFPVGTFHKGGNYGGDTNFPITQAEENNPLFKEAKDAGTVNARGCFPSTRV